MTAVAGMVVLFFFLGTLCGRQIEQARNRQLWEAARVRR